MQNRLPRLFHPNAPERENWDTSHICVKAVAEEPSEISAEGRSGKEKKPKV